MAGSMTLAELDQRLQAFPVAMLATISPKGDVHTRPMMTQKREPDGDLWFASALDSDKVAEIRQNPHVGVIYFRESDNACISLSGEATICNDPGTVRSKWQENWRPWFPEGPDQGNLCVIRVQAQSAELWEPRGAGVGVRRAIAREPLAGDPSQRRTA